MKIIFMYKGPTCDYLHYTLRAAKLVSSEHEVICISDRKWDAPGVEQHDWDTYAKGTDWFADLVNVSNDDVFHRRSFQRPAILLNFCEAHGIDRFFNADADVLLTQDIAGICQQWADCDFTMSICAKATGRLPGFSKDVRLGHANHSLCTTSALRQYIEFAKEYASKHKAIGCDMMVWSAFKEQTSLKWADTSSVFDHNIGTQLDTYHNDGEYKWIEWENGRAFKVRMADGGKEPMPLIHCWSGSKARIGDWFKIIESANREH